MILISDIYIYLIFTDLFRQLHVLKVMEAFLKHDHSEFNQ